MIFDKEKRFSKKVKLKVVAISLATNEDRGRLGVNDNRIPVYKAGMEVIHSSRGDSNYFPFLPTHITATLVDHPSIGEIYTLTFAKEEEQE